MLFEPMVKPDNPFRRLQKARTHLVWHTTWTQTDQRRQRLLDRLRECQRQWAGLAVEPRCGGPTATSLKFETYLYWPRRAVCERVELGRIFGFCEGGTA